MSDGHDRRIGILQIPLQRTIRRRPVRRLNLLDRHLTTHLHRQIRRRPRRRGHPDRVPVQLALQLRHDQPDRLRRTRARRHHVYRRRPRPPQILVRPVLQILIRRVGVDRGHQTPLDPRQVIEHLRQRRQAVRRARRVRDDVLSTVVVPVVDPHHQRQVRTRRRRRDDHLLRPGLQMLGRTLPLGEDPRRLQHHIDAQVLPRQRRRIPHRQTLEPLAVDHDVLIGRRHLIGQPTQDRVVLQQVRQRRVVGDVVHRHDLDVRRPRHLLRIHRPPEVAADPPEPVHAYSHGHTCSSLPRSSRSSRSAGAAVPVDALGTGVAPSRSPYPPAPAPRRSRRDPVDRPEGPLRRRPTTPSGEVPRRHRTPSAASHTRPNRRTPPSRCDGRQPCAAGRTTRSGTIPPVRDGRGNGGLTCDDETVRGPDSARRPADRPHHDKRRARP